MSETDEDDDLEFQQADAGLLFRAEMWLTNAFLGYWRHMLAVIVVVLLGFLLYGQYSTWVDSDQRRSSQLIDDAMAELPPLEEIGFRMIVGQSVEDTTLVTSAEELVTVADDSRGAAKVEALMKAAELYRLAKKPDEQRDVLKKAEGESSGVLEYGVQLSLANLELESGEGDAAVSRLRKLADREDVLGEQARIDLGRALETLDRGEEARKVYEEFEAKFPESSRIDEVRERKKAVAG